MSDLIVGAWRNGLSESTQQFVEEVEERQGKGFRQLPHEKSMLELVGLLEGYDAVTGEILDEEHIVAVYETDPPIIVRKDKAK